MRSALSRILEGRKAEHIFPTYYRANTLASLRALSEEAGFSVVQLEPFLSYPFTKGYLGTIESSVGRAMGWSSNILGILAK